MFTNHYDIKKLTYTVLFSLLFLSSNLIAQTTPNHRTDMLGFRANQSVISFPNGVTKLFMADGNKSVPQSFIIADLVDSVIQDGSVVAPVDQSILANINIDASLENILLTKSVSVLARSIPTATQGGTIPYLTDAGDITYEDMSTFYFIKFPDSVNVDTLKDNLQSVTALDSAYYWGIPEFFLAPPVELQQDCSPLDELAQYQWHLYGDTVVTIVHLVFGDTVKNDVHVHGANVIKARNRICDSIFKNDSIGTDVVVSILDGGFGSIQGFHPDLRSNVHPMSRVDFNDPLYNDTQHHGTHVAGVCGAATGFVPEIYIPDTSEGGPLAILPGTGVTGVAPTSKMILLTIRDDQYFTEDLITGLAYVVDSTDTDILNMSWGYTHGGSNPEISILLNNAYYEKGIALIAGSGNCGLGPIPGCGSPESYSFPATLPYVTAVGATDIKLDSLGYPQAAQFSTYGYYVDFAAPGVAILTTGPGGKNMSIPEYSYSSYEGTSFSTPILVGVMSLMMSIRPGIAVATMENILAETAVEQYNSVEWTPDLGYGLINADSAVKMMIQKGFNCDNIPGDVNTDCYVNFGDVRALFLYFTYDEPTIFSQNNADVNGDCIISVSDLSYLINYVNGNSPAPVPGCAGSGPPKASSGILPHITIMQNYPNPFNPETNISFSLPEQSKVTIEILNILGQKVETIVNGELSAGDHTVAWNGSKYSSGVYFYRLSAGDIVETKKMLLLK